MFKGLFYDFESEEQFVALVEKVRGKCKAEGECLIWQGGMQRGYPQFMLNQSESYRPRQLMFQDANPNYPLPQARVKIVCSCKNEKCLNANHLQVELLYKPWDTVAIHARLIEGCIRLQPTDGFDVGCLIRTKGIDARGYGHMSVNNKPMLTHTVSLLLNDKLTTRPIGQDGNKLMVRHKCANTGCCEPSHLEWGTPMENSDDRNRDGTHIVGEKNPCATITKDVASAIKLSWKPRGDPGYQSQSQRANYFGVSISLVGNIDAGASWNYLPGPSNKPGKIQGTERRKVDRDNLSEEDMKTLIDRIASRVKITPGISKDASLELPCHIFTGRQTEGYGVLRFHKLDFKAHVIVCEHKMKQRTPQGEVVRHRCGQKLCVCPDHLTFGTRTDNWYDAVMHDDVKRKLSVDDVKSIREIEITDVIAIRQAAKNHDTSAQHIKAIIRREKWTFIE
jgi:hypothetical protein